MVQDAAILEVKNLVKHFQLTKGILQRTFAFIKAVDGVSFAIKRGETLGLVGESGCGKTTVGRCILQLERPTAGDAIFEGTNLCHLEGEPLRRMRRKVQIIFQDPYSSLNPRRTIGDTIGELLQVHGMAAKKECRERVRDALHAVQLDPSTIDRYPHMFSGGQRQRIAIARALVLNPSFIVCDEPVSALDVSIQAQIVNLLMELQERLRLTYLFIAHDLSVVRHISHRVAIMYLGRIVEIAPQGELYGKPLHPYTRALLSAVPIPDPVVEAERQRIILTGEVPSPINVPEGCAFHPRCPEAMDLCLEQHPLLRDIGGHWVSCHRISAP